MLRRKAAALLAAVMVVNSTIPGFAAETQVMQRNASLRSKSWRKPEPAKEREAFMIL